MITNYQLHKMKFDHYKNCSPEERNVILLNVIKKMHHKSQIPNQELHEMIEWLKEMSLYIYQMGYLKIWRVTKAYPNATEDFPTLIPGNANFDSIDIWKESNGDFIISGNVIRENGKKYFSIHYKYDWLNDDNLIHDVNRRLTQIKYTMTDEILKLQEMINMKSDIISSINSEL